MDGDKEVSTLLNECRLDRADDRIMETISVGHESEDCDWDVQKENN